MSTTMMGVRRPVVADAGELQILARVDRGGVRVTVLAELEDRGLIA